MTRDRRARLIWFADLEALSEDLGVLRVLRDEAGLTTVAPESHISHTSGFRASEAIAARSPLGDWRERPGLADHRSGFGVPEPAMAVLPGVVGGDDVPSSELPDPPQAASSIIRPQIRRVVNFPGMALATVITQACRHRSDRANGLRITTISRVET